MEKASNVILGLRAVIHFTIPERHKIIQEMISLNCTKQEIWKKYTGRSEEHGQILKWIRQLGYNDEHPTIMSTLVENKNEMTKKRTSIAKTEDSFENLQLKKRITELERQLKDAEMKAIAFSTMVDIAEKQFNIPIRKKVNTKP
jgi:hypothetical protein